MSDFTTADFGRYDPDHTDEQKLLTDKTLVPCRISGALPYMLGHLRPGEAGVAVLRLLQACFLRRGAWQFHGWRPGRVRALLYAVG